MVAWRGAVEGGYWAGLEGAAQKWLGWSESGPKMVPVGRKWVEKAGIMLHNMRIINDLHLLIKISPETLAW
jgi:hypothetical protein